MKIINYPMDKLREIVTHFRHLQGEYRREGERGSSRRHLKTKLEELEQKFETLLAHWVPNEEAHASWRNHLHKGDPAPETGLDRAPPVFMGRSQLGSFVEVRQSSQGDYEILVDRTLVDRASSTLTFGDRSPAAIRIVDQDWTEISQASEPALEGLEQYIASPVGEPPWQWARMLFADGLIDLNFGLTPRGRRILSQR